MIFYLASPQYLWLLILVPLIPLAFALGRHLRKKRIRAFGDESLVAELMPSVSKSKDWVRIILFTLAFAAFVTGLCRPQIGAKLREHKSRGAEVMVVLDVSNSMLAEDYTPNRLERAKLAISRICDRLSQDRIGLIIFAGRSFVQLPVTTDYISAKMFLGTISTSSVPVQGTAIGDAIQTAIRSFSLESEKSRAIIVISDGENHEDDAVAAAAGAAESGIKVYTIGVGSPEGQPIPVNGELLKNTDGQIVVTKLNEQALIDIAKAGGGAYVKAGNEEFGLNPILDDIRAMEAEEFSSVVFEEYNEQYMYFFAIAFVLFCIEMLLGRRKPRKSLFR